MSRRRPTRSAASIQETSGSSVGDDGVGTGCTTPCGCSVAVGLNNLFRKLFRRDGHISFGMKQTGKPSAGNCTLGLRRRGLETSLRFG